MKSVFINVNAQITQGVCKGMQGKIIGADSILGLVGIELEPNVYVTLPRDYVYQDKDGMVLSLNEGNDVFGTYHGGSI